MMHHIRPYKIFTLFPSQRPAQITLPSRRGLGGTSLLETALIIACLRIVDARRVFEIGTFLGANTLNMALNTPDDSEVFTLDLESATGVKQDAADAPLTELHLAAPALDFVGSGVETKIKQLFGDSTAFDFSPWGKSIDLTFIDGGHDLQTVKSDTENALALAAVDRPSCILWHDYRSWDYPALSSYLDELSATMEIFHIEDTKLCVWFNGPANLETTRD